MKRIVIITSYLDTQFAFEKLINPGDYIICTDGGYDIARTHGVMPDLLLGDFDSITAEPPQNIETERFKPEKDFTDLELAVKKARSLNASEVQIIGGIGGRLDHTIANIQILSQYSRYFSSLMLRDGRNKCFIIYGNEDGEVSVPYEDHTYISLFALSENCESLTVQNTKYTLENYTLSRNIPLGVSNEFKEKKNAVISLKHGTLLVIISGK